MAWADVLFIVALLLSLMYGVLGFSAFAHIKPEEKESLSGQLVRFDPWWPYYNDMYLEGGRQSCFYGKVLFPIIVGAWVGWGVLQYCKC